MNCQNCGETINEGVKFCKFCGKESGKNVSTQADKALFYSEEWIRSNYFAIASIPNYDILITKTNLYLIQFPKTQWGTIGCILGFFILNLLGALIGAVIGGTSDKNKRKSYRSTWVNSNHELTSNEYEKNIFLQISKNKLKGCLALKKNKYIIIKKEDKSITLKKNKKEFTRFKTFVESYIK